LKTAPEGTGEIGTRGLGTGADPLHTGVLTPKKNENETEEDEFVTITCHACTALRQLPLFIHPPSQNHQCPHLAVGILLLAPGMSPIVARGEEAEARTVEAAAAEVAAVSAMDDTRVRRGGRTTVIETKKKTGGATRVESLRRFRKDEAF